MEQSEITKDENLSSTQYVESVPPSTIYNPSRAEETSPISESTVRLKVKCWIMLIFSEKFKDLVHFWEENNFDFSFNHCFDNNQYKRVNLLCIYWIKDKGY